MAPGLVDRYGDRAGDGDRGRSGEATGHGSTPGSPTPHAEPKQVLTLYYYTGLYFYILLPVGRFSLRGFPTWRLQSCSAHFLASAVK